MIVKCPDCGQELTDTTLYCPMCGCRTLSRQETAVQETRRDKILKVLRLILTGTCSPFYLFFHLKGGLNKLQFFFSLIYMFLIFYLCHFVRREFLTQTPVKEYYTGTAAALLLLDLSVLWKRLYAVDWKRNIVFPIILLLLAAVFTRIEILSELSLLIFLLLHAILFATPEQPEA